MEEKDQAEVREHFDSLAKHTDELFELYAKHADLMLRLDASLTNIRAKAFIWYRQAKQRNRSIPWLRTPMELVFEGAFEHAIPRTWNGCTAAKANQLQRFLGKKATDMAKEKEPMVDVCNSTSKRPRVEGHHPAQPSKK